MKFSSQEDGVQNNLVGILLVLGLLWSACGEEAGEAGDVAGENGRSGEVEPSTGPGGMILAEGYQHVFTGDSASNSGHISKSPTPTIVYTIGAHTGNFVHELATDQGITPEERKEGDRTFLIARQGELLYVTVLHDEAGEDSKEYPANFQGPVTDEEAEEVIEMITTYNP